jgi:uncharacterized protein with GYD domain
MHFCATAQYTPQALNAIMENPTTNRYEAFKKLVEAAGGKLISMYSTGADGPGVLAIFDVPDPAAAAAISGVVTAGGAVHNALAVQAQDCVRQTSASRAIKAPRWCSSL